MDPTDSKIFDDNKSVRSNNIFEDEDNNFTLYSYFDYWFFNGY